MHLKLKTQDADEEDEDDDDDDDANDDDLLEEFDDDELMEAVTSGMLQLSPQEVTALQVRRKKFEAKRESEKKARMADEINLAGLLNTLDGIIDSPGR